MTFNLEPPLVLAPMAGLTHAPFRELVAHYGGCGLYYTEMLNSRVISTQSLKKDPYCIVGERDRPLAAQVTGSDPEKISRAYERLQEMGNYEIYDFNLGCSRGVAYHHGWGANLLKKPDLVKKILQKCRPVIEAPFLVKMRLPGARDDLEKWGTLLAETGVDAIVLHPRMPKDLFRRPARWEEIGFLKQMVSLPVIGNGDVFSPEDALKMMQDTLCDGVMIGRAALMRPWIFRDTLHFFKTGEIPAQPDPEEVIRLFIQMLNKYLPNDLRTKKFRLFSFWFSRNFPHGHFYYKETSRETTLSSMAERLLGFVSGEKIPPYPVRPA